MKTLCSKIRDVTQAILREKSISLKQRLANFFCKGIDSKILLVTVTTLSQLLYFAIVAQK